MNPTWRSHPRLVGQFHPQYPDDIQIVIHEGGPRLSNSAPELFPDAPPGAELEAFTSFCGFCSGIQGIESLKGNTD